MLRLSPLRASWLMRLLTPLGVKSNPLIRKNTASKDTSLFLLDRFVGQSAAAMEEHTGRYVEAKNKQIKKEIINVIKRCEEAIATRQPAKMVDNTSSIAR